VCAHNRLERCPDVNPVSDFRGASVIAALRRGTEAAHADLEQRVSLGHILATRTSYTAFLGRMLGVFAPLEPVLELALRDWPALALVERRKTPLLLADLRALGLSAGEIAGLPRVAALAHVEDEATALGTLYVLEGTTLGGKLIAREAEARLGIAPANGGSFHAAYGQAVGQRWRELVAVLEGAAEAGQDPDRMVTGAQDAFAAVESWLCR
jgi:heme oxygenase